MVGVMTGGAQEGEGACGALGGAMKRTQGLIRFAGGVTTGSRVIPWLWRGQPLGEGVIYTEKGTLERGPGFCGVR